MQIVTNSIVVLLLAGVSSAYASFDLRPLPPAERGAACHLALGAAEVPVDLQDARGADGVRLRTLQVYGFKPFGLDEADFIGASAGFMLRHDLDIRLSYHRLKVLSYREQTCLLSCLWKSGVLRFEPTVGFGAVELEQSVVDRAVLFDFAVNASPLPGLRVFFGARNPFALGLLRSGERCPTDIRAGLGYAVSAGLVFGVEVCKEGGFPTSVATGAEARLAKGVILRTGIRTDPKEFSLGFGLRAGRVALDTSASFHMDLGLTHEAGVTYIRD